MTTPLPKLSHPKYRPDIDGLRAIAVLPVVIFHAFPAWMKGGFIGVDVFFVISGFLISTIIFESLDKGAFSFAEFYSRRIKRIFPALLLVLIASYAFGWFALLTDEYKQLGKHIAAGAGFIANFILWGETGYFDNSAETKPLLHLWSLGIEEQFYIIWPLLLWLAWRRKFNLPFLIILVTAVSFYLNTQGIKQDRVATFYSPQTRFWELLCGSILAWLTLYRKEYFNDAKPKIDGWPANAVYRGKMEIDDKILSNVISFSGCALLVFGFYRINKDLNFPGNWAVIPVSGATLIILAGPRAWINKEILSNKLAIWFGLISFPLYLWHWPILSFARIVESTVPSPGIHVAAVGLSILLAWMTYRLVERPMRLGKNSKSKVVVLTILLAVTGLAGYITYKENGFAFRMKDREEFINYFENSFPNWSYFRKINLPAEWRSECAFFNGKKYREEGKLEGGVTNSKPVDKIDDSCFKTDSRFDKRVLIWGDSHAQSLSPGIMRFIPSEWQVLQIASSGCAPNPNIDSPSSVSQCDQSNYFALKTIKSVIPDVVVIAQADGHSSEAAAEISAKLKTFGVKKILFLGPTPQWESDLPKIFARQLWITKPKRTFIGVKQDLFTKNELLLRSFPADDTSQFVDVIGLFCDSNGCLTYIDDDIKETMTTWDYGHLTPSASKYLAQHLLVKRIVGD